ncbi:PKD domain-containing protein [Photobacterium sp.]|uniref:PKD domain-containing protein n=1 Tax=Photobacterium sp. TaxID=660 RepID=UPI00299D65F1|nr:carbohydrate-binding protein [Photobacterium sp.]MDX1301772.1 PKD domain-containing protein [Photobacterium sp.]
MERLNVKPILAATVLGLCSMQAQAVLPSSDTWPAQIIGVNTYQLDPALFMPTGKIRLGQMDFELSQAEIDQVSEQYKAQGQEVVDQQIRILKLKRLVWLAPYSFQLPNERPHWAMAMAHAAALFKNVTGIDDPYHDANLYAAKSLQEAGMGADYANVPGYFTYPILPKYQDVDATQPDIRGIWNTLRGGRTKHDGFFQLEGHMYSAYGELMRMFPNRFYKDLYPTDDYHAVTPAEKTSPLYNQIFKPEPGKNSFVPSAIGASYYNIFAYYTVARSAQEFGLFAKDAKDPQALTKIISVGYNRGLSSESLAMFPLKPERRDACMQKANIDSCFDLTGDGSGGFGINYLYQVPYKAKALKEVADTSGPGYPGYYTSNIDWQTIITYLDALAPLYTKEELQAAQDGAYIAFSNIQQNGVIDFANQFGDVLDAILLALPVDTPWSQLCNKDGSIYDAFDRNGTFKGQESTYKCLPESVEKPLYLEKPAGDVAPVAYAGADIKVTSIGSVELTGALSHDRNGDALSFNWSQVSGTPVTLTNANTVKPSFAVTDLTTATYTFQLTVTANGKSSSDTITVTVEKASSGGGEAIWQPSVIYNKGDKVTFNGEEYTAKWWTQGDQPGVSAVWNKTSV